MNQIPRGFKLAALVLMAPGLAKASEYVNPAWWTNPALEVVDPLGKPSDRGIATIGQLKWMAYAALSAVKQKDPVLGAAIEMDLTGAGNPISDFDQPETGLDSWLELQKSAANIGQLKAVAAPFYEQLHLFNPDWLRSERVANGTLPDSVVFDSQGQYPSPWGVYPWTDSTADDANFSLATIGQLKAVFALRIERLEEEIAPTDPALMDTDGDGLSDAAEITAGTSSSDADTDGDGIPDGQDPNPLSPDLVSSPANTSIHVWTPSELLEYIGQGGPF